MGEGEVNAGAPVGQEAYAEIQQFYYREADLLDERDYQKWFLLLTDTIRYRITAKVIREAGAPGVAYDLVDADLAGMRRRVDQVSNPRLTHAENPPSFTRRFITNLQVVAGAAGEFATTANVLVYRQRLESPDGVLYVGKRHDMLQRRDGALRIAKRHVVLDQAAFAGSVTVFL
jgi:3-phenylpropionate/cinnamic acid dioxygenase small subunit